MGMIIAIACGGAVGALARHFFAAQITHIFGTGGFPYGIFAANILGSFLMGVLVECLLKLNAQFPLLHSPEVRGFLAVGLLGAFTTFSTFSLETVLLIERQQYLLAGVYVAGSVVLSVSGLFLGLWLMRTLLV
ncbi:fluoride efflux transporter CrcB [Rhodovibrionaceae bacterium A322]